MTHIHPVKLVWSDLTLSACIIVECTYVRTSFDESLLFLGEYRQTVPHVLLEGSWVVAKVDGIGKPSDSGVHLVLSCLHI